MRRTFLALMLLWAVLCLFAMLALLVPPPAHAAQACHTRGDLCWPMEPGAVLVLESPYRGNWGMRHFARAIDAEVDGLTIHARRRTTCEDHPEAYCVVVEKRFMEMDNGAYAQPPAWYEDRTGVVVLNTRYSGDPYWASYRRFTAGHELLHVLGFDHHEEEGMCIWDISWPLPQEPSSWELDVLRGWYGR